MINVGHHNLRCRCCRHFHGGLAFLSARNPIPAFVTWFSASALSCRKIKFSNCCRALSNRQEVISEVAQQDTRTQLDGFRSGSGDACVRRITKRFGRGCEPRPMRRVIKKGGQMVSNQGVGNVKSFTVLCVRQNCPDPMIATTYSTTYC